MRRAIPVILLVCIGVCGCTSMISTLPPSREKTSQEAALEENARLKKQLEAEVDVNSRLAYELEKMRIELQKAQAGLAATQGNPAETVPAFQDYEVARVDLGMLTGTADWDGTAGCDGIIAYLLLKDSEGDVLKRKGNCAFELLDASGSEGKVIMSWAVPAEVLGTYWHSIPAGFRVKLSWQGDPPYGRECVLKATFIDAYGRIFTAARLLKVEARAQKAEESAKPTETAK
jgi:hypothetical protein